MSIRIRQVLRPVLPPQATNPNTTRRATELKDRSFIPFFRDPGHTIPTKWGLYRPLLRLTSSDSFTVTKREIRSRWKETKGLTSVPRVKSFLLEYYQLLDYLRLDTLKCKDELKILEERLKEKHQRMDSDNLKTQRELKEKIEEEGNVEAKLTGGYHRPTLFNVPLPRLKPQPKSIGSMIHNRLRARERRISRRKEYAGLLTDMKLEVGFWKSAQQPHDNSASASTSSSISDLTLRSNQESIVQDDWTKPKDPRSPGGWDGILKSELKVMDERFKKENRRAEMVFDQSLMDRIAKAKERKKLWWNDVKTKKNKHRSDGGQTG